MFKRIDETPEDLVTGFSYESSYNRGIESVKMSYGIADSYVSVRDGEDDEINIYYQDIPKLIKALQAAYDFKGN